MSWWAIIMRALELFRAIMAKTNKEPPPAAVGPGEKPPVKITRASVDAQVARQRKLYKMNHPKKGKRQ